MKILAIDAATEVCSAALMCGREIAYQEHKAPRQHAKLILPMINGLLTEAGFGLSELDVLALTIGPGSFTGLRIAASVVQGLAYGADLPVVIVSTLAVLAQGAYAQFQVRQILPSLDARMQQVYWGAYQINQQELAEPMMDDALSDPDKVLMPAGDNWVGVGSGWEAYENMPSKRLSQIYPAYYPQAKYILPLAQHKFTQGDLVAAALVVPVYLREAVV